MSLCGWERGVSWSGRNIVLWEALLGLFVGAMVGWGGYCLGALALSGVAAVSMLSGLNFGLVGWEWGAVPLLSVLSFSFWDIWDLVLLGWMHYRRPL